MNLIKLQLWALSEEDFELEENERIAEEIIKKIFYLFPKSIIYKSLNLSSLSLLATLYYYIGKENIKYKQVLDTLLSKYGLCEKAFILSFLQDLINEKHISISSIGIYDFFEYDKIIEVSTTLGEIFVQKASEIFTEDKYQELWQNTLTNHCFHRTYDFLELNPNYHAVLSFLPNYLCCGYYHAYLENDNSIIDIARNLYFPKKEDGEKLLAGDIIARLSFDEILKWEQFLKENVNGYRESNYAPLGVLSWYLDFKEAKLQLHL